MSSSLTLRKRRSIYQNRWQQFIQLSECLVFCLTLFRLRPIGLGLKVYFMTNFYGQPSIHSQTAKARAGHRRYFLKERLWFRFYCLRLTPFHYYEHQTRTGCGPFVPMNIFVYFFYYLVGILFSHLLQIIYICNNSRKIKNNNNNIVK